MKRVVIIGGGITGLAATHRILERSEASGERVLVTLLESSDRLGGIVETHQRDGFLIETGPDSFLSEKPAALDLAHRLGLQPHLIETNKNFRRSFVVRRGRLRPVPRGFQLLAPAELWPFFRSDIFSWRGKARMALDMALPRRSGSGSSDESLASFVRRRLGQEALERMGQPMVGGIYTADPETLSLRATMPRFLEMESEHRSLIRALRKQNRNPTEREGSEAGIDTSGARYSLFVSFDRGMQLLTDKLAERISELHSQIANANFSERPLRLNATVDSLSLEKSSSGDEVEQVWKIRTDDGETLSADAVCIALPAHVSAALFHKVEPQLASHLGEISYASSATLNLGYRRSDIPHHLDGFGFVVPFIERRSMIACTFNSVKFSGRAPEGCVLLRVFVGGALQPEMLELSEAELLSRVRADLRDLLGVESAPMFSELRRWERSMPQYHVGHLDLVARINERVASLPQLALAGNAYSGPGLPDCIRSGETAADELLKRVWRPESNQ
ncbi:MAG TPA: protoporphyrinogen oxidase [Pyrinomonadaceae bacterium]|nr:protoporphyrinogen oxidase [Pyrinomonadaceae bacterium]